MRQVVLDTETTGLEWEKGHRIIEIGCVELVNRRKTERTFHRYLQPDREIDEAAEEVHGLSSEMLADKPNFKQIVGEFLDFVDGAELVIHNADFDVGFLNYELRMAGWEPDKIEHSCRVLDTLKLARQLHPGQRNSLDALCKRYDIDNSRRDVHGALLDARAIARDLTRRRESEEEQRRLEGRLQQAEKLESLGDLAAGIAHDYNNLLTGMLVHADLALDEIPRASPPAEKIRQIGRTAERAAELSDQLLAFAGEDEPELETLDLGNC